MHFAANPQHRAAAPRLAARVTLFSAAALLAASAAHPQPQWGVRSFEEERPDYFAQVKQLEREANQLLSRVRQVRNDTQAFLGRYSEQERVNLVQKYERHTDYNNRHRRFRQEYEKERQAKALYDDARAVFSPQDERRAEVRANLWTKNLEWRRSRIAARRAQLSMLDSQLVVMQGLTGIDWEEFWADTAGDILYVYKEVLTQYPKDVYQCLVDTGSAQLGGLLGGLAGPQPLVSAAPMPLVPDMLMDIGGKCVIGSGYKALVNAFEAAWKKQFLDRMKELGVIDGVGEYWWDEIIVAKLPEDKSTLDKLNRFLADQAQKTATGTIETYVQGVTAQTLVQRELPGLKQRYQALVSSASPPSKADLTGQMLKNAQEGGQARADELMKSAKLVVDYTQKAAELYYNSQTFSAIEGNELKRYGEIVRCLTDRQQPVTARTVIAELKRDAASFASFTRACYTAAADDGTESDPPGSDRVEEILAHLHALAGVARSNAGLAQSECSRAREGLGQVQSALDRLPARISALSAKVQASRQTLGAASGLPARAKLHESEAYAAAGRIVAAKQQVEVLERDGCLTSSTGAGVNAGGAAQKAGEARALATTALQDLAAARSAAQQAALLAQQLSTAFQLAQSLPNESAALRNTFGEAQASLAATQAAAQSAMDHVASLPSLENEAAGLYAEATALLPAMPEAAARRAALDGALAQVRSIRASLGECPGDLAGRVAPLGAVAASIETSLAELEAEISSVESAAGNPLALEALRRSVAEANASAGTAEVFAEAIQAAAARTAACAARAVAQPSPAPTPSATPGAWKTGPITSVGPTQPTSGTTPPGFDASPLIQAAKAEAAACRYPAALSYADQLSRAAPGHAWLAANHTKLRDLAGRQSEAVGMMKDGQAALGRKDFSGAWQATQRAAQRAPSCMRDLIEGFGDAVKRAANDDRKDRAGERQASRDAAAAMLPALIDILNKTIEAKNDSGSSQSGGSANSGGSRGSGDSGSTADRSDPCASKATYLNKWNPEPRCDCSGYEWNGYKCVPGSGGGGKVAGSRDAGTGGGGSGGATETCSCKVDGSGAGGSDHFCDTFIESRDSRGKHRIIHIVNKGRPKGWKPPQGWAHGRFNTCEVLSNDSPEDCASFCR